MDNSEWSERNREYALATAHEGGIVLPETAGDNVRFVAALMVEFRYALAMVATPKAQYQATWLLRNHARQLRYWQWQSWRTGK